MNNVIILTKRGTDNIHAIIPKKYQKYTSTTIPKHVDVLDKVNKLPYMCLLYMTPHDSYIIKIHVCTMNISVISHDKKE